MLMRTPNEEHSSLEYAALGLIRKGVTYGYEIFKQISDQKGLGQIWQTKPGNLYALLGKMVSSGWLVSLVKSEGNRPPRKEFSLTPEGEKAFEAWCSSTVKHPREMRQDFLARWYFVRDNPQVSSELIRDQLEECSAWEAGLLSKEQEVEATAWFESNIYQFRINQIRGIKNWLNQLQRGEI
jgi:DNA-binding PadR family transcriptional regulator